MCRNKAVGSKIDRALETRWVEIPFSTSRVAFAVAYFNPKVFYTISAKQIYISTSRVAFAVACFKPIGFLYSFSEIDLHFNQLGCLHCGQLQANWFFILFQRNRFAFQPVGLPSLWPASTQRFSCRYFPVTDFLQATRPFKSPW